MMSRNGSMAGGASGRMSHMPTSIKPSIKKKPAPPRPPQPSINRLQTSMSFNTGQDLASQQNPNAKPRNDLIDFRTPPSSPNAGRRNTVSNISTALRDPNEFSYRVGASIFYIKSPLKNSASETPIQNPFSPPRPSAESLGANTQKPVGAGNMQSHINADWSSRTASNHATATSWDTPPVASSSNALAARVGVGSIHSQFQTSSSLENNNTIKSNYQTPSPWLPAGASSSSNASSDRTSASFTDFGGNSQPRYGNVPVPVPVTGKKELSATLSSGSGAYAKPTIIRPANKIPSQSSQDVTPSSAQVGYAAINNALRNMTTKSEVDNGAMQRNYYDIPPEEDEDEDGDDEFNNSSFQSPPMPSEPPPPPPPEVLAVDEWVSSTTSVTDYPDTYSDAEQVTAYAFAIYDFTPETEGDLQLQTGDLVYLLRKVDDAWYHGSCGGMEGMFPSNFVNVMVPLPEESAEDQSQGGDEGVIVDALYDFAAETESDISLQIGEKVKVLGRLNEDWLYGEKDGSKGQFPAAFVRPILQELPYIKI